jgi:hypothetical protein
LAAAAWLTFDVLPGPASTVVLLLAVLLSVIFLFQIAIHRRVRRQERWEAVRASLAREGMLRLDRDWRQLDEVLPEGEGHADDALGDHPYAKDLNVVGAVSLARLAGPVTSERGRATLRGWLLQDAEPAAAQARQRAVRELAPLHTLRTEFAALGRLEGPRDLRGLERFFAWAEGSPMSEPRPWLSISTWVLPPVLVAGLVGYFVYGWPPWWILPAVAQFSVLRRTSAQTKSAFSESAVGGPPLKALVPQLDLLAGQEWSGPALTAIADRFGRADNDARRHLARLSRLLDYVESRRNAFYATLAPVFLLEVHLWRALDRWRAAHGRAVRDWLEALGEWEALSALATIGHDHPDWSYPDFQVDGPRELRATALGHPLLPPDTCVRNDVSVGPPGTFLFVTGSNMSGKSTLLRALGANAILAGSGAPVCAAALTLRPVQVRTSMRIEDSLAEGISLFMAELLRIKGVVDAASAAEQSGRTVLYLLDEVLHGTNTAERRIAARGVLRHLLSAGAIGAVSSHDLTLADAPDLQSAAHAVHFREEVGSGDGGPAATLTFDYKLRPGTATTRNALKLLDAVGLGALREPGERP